MKTIKEYTYEPKTNNTATGTTKIGDEQKALDFYTSKIKTYDNNTEWEFIYNIENGKKYKHKLSNNFCEITIK